MTLSRRRCAGRETPGLLEGGGVKRSGAAAIADRIHEAVGNMNLENRASPMGGRLTVSVGAGVSDAEFSIGAAALVDLADRALYEAKRLGRNQTCLRSPVSGPELVGNPGDPPAQAE